MDLNNIKDRIKDIELDFDQNEVWQNIQKEQKKNRRGLSFWFSSILGALVLVVGLFFLVDRTQQSNLDESKIDTASKVDVVVENISQSSAPLITDGQELTQDNFENGFEEENEVTSENVFDREAVEVNSNIISNVNSVSKHTLVNTLNVNDNIGVGGNTSLVSDNINTIASDQRESFLKLKTKRNAFESNDDSSISTIFLLENNTYESNSFSKSEKSSPSSQRIAMLQERTKVHFSELNSSMAISPLNYDYTLDGVYQQFVIKNQIEPLMTFRNNPVTIKAVFENGMLNRNIAIVDGDWNSSVLEEREKTETTLEHMITGISVSTPISKVLYINSGIEFHRMSDKLEYSSTTIRPLNQDDLPVGVSGRGFVISNTSNVYYNHLNLINVPLELGARWSQARFSEFVSVGASINLRTSGRQYYLDEFQSLTDNAKNVRTKFNNSYVFKAGLAYDLLPRVEWSLHASYRYMPNVSAESSNYIQSYQSYMIGTGIGYKF